MFGEDSVSDELELGLVSRRCLLLLGCLVTPCLFIRGQVAVELWIELVPNFLGEAQLAELSKDCPQEALLVHCQIILGDLEEERLCLA